MARLLATATKFKEFKLSFKCFAFHFHLLGSLNSSKMNPQGMLGLERPYLRARRRVRQRVDAGEPRNSYSSIPGFSFRTNAGCGPNVSTTPPINPAVSSP